MEQLNKERLYEVIRKPLITEKSTHLAQNNQIVFEVATSATKKEIKNSIEFLFNTKVQKITTLNQNGKVKIFKGKPGRRKSYKKAVVTLSPGQSIDLSSGV